MSGDFVKSSAAAERIVANSSTVELPLLTKTNYHEWSFVMQVSLEALGLWAAVETDKVDRHEDRLAQAAILHGVPTEMKAELAVKTSAKEAWVAVRAMRRGDERVKEANAQTLLKEVENVAFRDGESIDEFVLRISSIAGNLRELGEDMKEQRVVKKILRVLPKKYNMIACAIEMLMDLNKMSIEELVGQLRMAEERCGADEVADGVQRLLLTEEQWEARRRQRGKERTRGGDARRGRGNKDGDRGGRHVDDDDDASSTRSGKSSSDGRHRGRCLNCGERGHIAKFCTEKKGGKALLADADEEPALL